MRESIRVTAAAFDPENELRDLRLAHPSVGAIVSFLGLMRDMNDGERVTTMRLEHYAGMTERALQGIVHQAHARWELAAVRVLHRVGELRPQDPIVLVMVASAHRGTAFAACEFIIDYLKTRAPFWKKEQTPQGARWVAPRAADAVAEARWEPE
jgi:molybdopterin synthase catalytic subunit